MVVEGNTVLEAELAGTVRGLFVEVSVIEEVGIVDAGEGEVVEGS